MNRTLQNSGIHHLSTVARVRPTTVSPSAIFVHCSLCLLRIEASLRWNAAHINTADASSFALDPPLSGCPDMSNPHFTEFNHESHEHVAKKVLQFPMRENQTWLLGTIDFADSGHETLQCGFLAK